MISLTIPGLRLVSEANRRDHWAAKARRVKDQRSIVALALRQRLRGMRLPCVVTITRIAPRRLDDDNAVSSAKACRDSIAALLGVDDRDPRVTWRVEQERGAYAVRVEIRSSAAIGGRPDEQEEPDDQPACPPDVRRRVARAERAAAKAE